MSENRNPDGDVEVDDADALAEELGLNSSDDASDGGGDDEHAKKVRHAFALQKKMRKQAEEENAKLKAELEQARKPVTPPPASNTGGQRSAKTVINALKAQAMSNLGVDEVTEDTAELVNLECQRLYSLHVSMLERRREAEAAVPHVIEKTLKAVEVIDDSDREIIKKRVMEKYGNDPVRAADESVVMGEVKMYLGELKLNGDSHRVTQGDDAAHASAGAAKRGRTGVTVTTPSTGSPEDTKPATEAEIAGMKKLGMSDLKMYREAVKRKSKYMS